MPFARIKHLVEQNERTLLIALLSLSLLAGMIYSIHLGDQIRFYDEYDYLRFADHLVEKGMYSMHGDESSAYRPPGYPVLEAAVLLPAKWLGLPRSVPLVILRIINYLALILSAFLLYRLVCMRAGAIGGLLAAIMLIGYPLNFFTAGTLYPQTLALFLLVVMLTLLFGKKEHTSRDYFVLGLVVSVAVLVVPSFIFTLLIICGWLFLTQVKERIKPVVLVLVGSAILICPWIVRNYLVFDTFVFISTNSGVNLLLGNSENTGPNSGVNVDLSRYEMEAETRGLGELERNKFYTKKAVEYILDNKAAAFKLYVLKFLNYFNFRNNLATASAESTARWLIMLVTYGFILVVGLPLRLILSRMKQFSLTRLEAFALLLYVSNGLFAAIFFTRIRFRMPYDSLLIVCAAILLGLVIKHYVESREPAAVE